VFGFGRFGSSLSVLDSCAIGSSLSIRSFVRLGSTLSIVGAVRLANLHFEDAGTIYAADSSGGTSRRISLPSSGAYEGILHGTWSSETSVSTSDRRLKKDIAPLYRTIVEHMKAGASKRGGKSNDARPTKDQASSAIGWMLRELRPVSYTFKGGSESKALEGRQRFGFIAQEVENVIPELVHELGKTKHLVYQDLIAVITLAAQDHQKRLESTRGEVSKLKGMVQQLAGAMGHLSRRVASMVQARASAPRTPTSVGKA